MNGCDDSGDFRDCRCFPLRHGSSKTVPRRTLWRVTATV